MRGRRTRRRSRRPRRRRTRRRRTRLASRCPGGRLVLRDPGSIQISYVLRMWLGFHLSELHLNLFKSILSECQYLSSTVFAAASCAARSALSFSRSDWGSKRMRPLFFFLGCFHSCHVDRSCLGGHLQWN